MSLPTIGKEALLSRNTRILFVTRAIRTFAYGQLAVILALYLAARGFADSTIGLIFTATLLGDAAVSLAVGGIADRIGRRRLLILSCSLVVLAGLTFALTGNAVLLTLAAIIGTISPSGSEVGPFLSLEQASISQEATASNRTRIFAWYQLVGSTANACGALFGGFACRALQDAGRSDLDAYRTLIFGYAGLGLVLAVVFTQLSSAIEPAHLSRGAREPSALVPVPKVLGLHRSRRAVLRLSALFAVDSFGSGLVLQTLIAYFLHRKFGADVRTLGSIFFVANTCAGLSALLSPVIARRIGLVRTMVFTHLPANVLLIAFPFMPTLRLSVVLLLARFLTAQMDVPARTSYTMSIVDDDERSAASSVTSQAKLLGASLGPVIAGAMGLSAWPFVVSGILKILYDLSLYGLFKAQKPPEER